MPSELATFVSENALCRCMDAGGCNYTKAPLTACPFLDTLTLACLSLLYALLGALSQRGDTDLWELFHRGRLSQGSRGSLR